MIPHSHADRIDRPQRSANPLLLVLLLAAALLSAQQPPAAPASALTEARSLADRNDFAAADSTLRKHLASQPKDADALYLLGYVLQRENKPKESLAVFTEAAAVRLPLPNDLKLVALDYVLLQDYTDAARWLTRSIEGDPKNAEAWYSLGRVHMEQGDFTAAERNLRRALALNPNDAKALDNLGLSLEAQNRGDEALAEYGQAIAAQANGSRRSEQPLLNLGALLNTKNRSAEAVQPLQAAVALAPACPRCHEELARALLATRQDTPAMHEMEQAVALDPKNPRLHYQLGQIYRRAGMRDKADAELKASSTLYGSHSTPVNR